jgi:transposase
MLGKQDNQRGIFEAASQLDQDELEEMGLYGQMARYGSEVFQDEDFAHMYETDNGRPSTPPSILARARLLQHYEDISEREVIRRCKYDIRWKVALGLDLQTTEKPFARTTFQAFRYRLTLHGEEGLVFEKSLERAAKQGLVDGDLEVALDSSPVRGRGAVQDTYQQISAQIGSVLRAVAKAESADPEALANRWDLSRHIEAPSIKGTEVVDWSSDEEVDAFLGRLVEEAARAVEMANESAGGSEAVKLLERIIDEDVDQDPDGGEGPTVAEGTARERIVSTSDPEMRHGRKSTSGKYDGHKAHIGVDTESGVIVDVDMTAPSTAESSQIGAAVGRIEERTGLNVGWILGDSAYGTRQSCQQADKAEVKLRTKMPAPNASWQFGADAFEVSEEGDEVECPAGNEPERTYYTKSRGGWQHHFAEADCQNCPLKDQCTNADRRTFFVADDFHQRRRRRQWAKSPEGRQVLKRRLRVEHAIGRLKQWGAGQARYFGRAKTREQWEWTAAVANLSLVWSHRDARETATGNNLGQEADKGAEGRPKGQKEPVFSELLHRRQARRITNSRSGFGTASTGQTTGPTDPVDSRLTPAYARRY